MDPNPKAKYLREAAYAAVICWKNCLSVEDTAADAQAAKQEKREEKKKATTGKNKEAAPEEVFTKREIPDNKKKMIEAFDDLHQVRAGRARARRASSTARRASTTSTTTSTRPSPLFGDIAENHKSNELAVYSANLLIDCLNVKKDYNGIAQYVDKFLATEEYKKDADFMKLLGVIKGQLTRKRIEETEKDKRYVDAARLYIKLAEEYPDDPKIDEVYFNAGVNFEKAKLIGPAIQAREAAHQGQARLDARQEGRVPARPQLPGHRGLRARGEELRGFRDQVPGREGGLDRAQHRVLLPSRSR